ncbi:FAS1 domain-containing protein [Leucogyrophana mollusca]|uniref:FAS1 domain-containing protein n=1 Tax=Leucogyrophana mollusca TaxID=85980 RepID=A0ACB8BSY0_9AGAM|nr:FAS1 domain-containing protein [Leucogyrophana mollusca]
MRFFGLAPILCLTSALALRVPDYHGLGQISLGILSKCGGIQSAEERTIYQVLKEDESFSRLVKAIDLSDRVVSLLDDADAGITFFAVPNSGLPHPRPPGHEDLRPGRGDDRDIPHNLGDLVLQVEQLDHVIDDDDKEHRKQALARIIRGILAYHILPEKLESAQLVENNTYATNLTLKDGSLDYEPLRISVQSTTVPPRLRLNQIVEVTKRDIEATNGVIHAISLPLLPPPSIFQEAFLIPEVFSYTSALQRVGLTGAVDRRHVSGEDGKKGSFQGATATTFFAPTSGAFERLPRKLRLFLFSPFGENALRKILEYHIVPQFVLHTDYYHDARPSDSAILTSLDEWSLAELQASMPDPNTISGSETGYEKRPRPPLPDPVYAYNVTLPTLLQDRSLHVEISRYKSKLPVPGPPRYFTTFRVNGEEVGPFDVPARNGALHVITKLLDPRGHRHRGGHDDYKHHKHRDGHGVSRTHRDYDAQWEDWEEWLPQWAAEN